MPEALKVKVLGLPGYVWVGVLAASVVVYWKVRGGGSSVVAGSDASTPSDMGDASTDTTAGAQGYTEGYGSGYDTGLYEGGILPGGSGGTGTTVAQPAPTNLASSCRDLKDPSGRLHRVCGYGHWYEKKGAQQWYWTPGPIPAKKKAGKYAPAPPPTLGSTGEPAKNAAAAAATDLAMAGLTTAA